MKYCRINLYKALIIVLFFMTGCSTKEEIKPENAAKEYLIKAQQFQKNKDYVNAMKMYQEAAKLGNTDAIGNMGIYYYSGLGVAQDSCKGFDLQKEAATKGNPWFQVNVGELQRVGICYLQDLEAAKKSYEAALKNSASSVDVKRRANEGLKALADQQRDDDYERPVHQRGRKPVPKVKVTRRDPPPRPLKRKVIKPNLEPIE